MRYTTFNMGLKMGKPYSKMSPKGDLKKLISTCGINTSM